LTAKIEVSAEILDKCRKQKWSNWSASNAWRQN